MTARLADEWRERLDAALAGGPGPLHRVHVLAETPSTQDAARALGAAPGAVVVACRQTGGRGRLGRRWADTGSEGLAVTIVLPRERGGRPGFAAALAAAEAASRWLAGDAVGVKWPNDVVVGDRKLAGVLVEQDDARALIGIGLNVNQRRWPEPLAGRAISLRQARAEAGGDGTALDRVEVAAALLERSNALAAAPPAEIARRFHDRDVLAGRTVRVRVAADGCWRELRGRLLGLDPELGLALEVTPGRPPLRLPAATSSVLAVEP